MEVDSIVLGKELVEVVQDKVLVGTVPEVVGLGKVVVEVAQDMVLVGTVLEVVGADKILPGTEQVVVVVGMAVGLGMGLVDTPGLGKVVAVGKQERGEGDVRNLRRSLHVPMETGVTRRCTLVSS